MRISTSRSALVLAAVALVSAWGFAQAGPPPQAAPPPQQATAPGGGQAGPPLKNIQVLTGLTRPEVLAKMRTFTTGLGVQCSFCHVEGDFSKDDKDQKATARRMITMVAAINKDNFHGREEVACYTCHRGAERPLRQPPAGAGGPGGPGGRGGGGGSTR